MSVEIKPISETFEDICKVEVEFNNLDSYLILESAIFINDNFKVVPNLECVSASSDIRNMPLEMREAFIRNTVRENKQEILSVLCSQL